MKITFRTDTSHEIGTGHLMRCLTLAEALRAQGATCCFVTREHPGNLAGRIEDEGFAVIRLPAPQGQPPEGPPAHAHWAGVDWVQDAEETRAALDVATPDWIVVDHYSFDARWQHAARPEGTKMMVIDDLADRSHEADLLLDQNLGRAESDYDGLVPETCQRLIGPRFALLRPEFSAARAEALAARAGRGLKHMLISMGGVDGADATSAVLTALRDAPLPDDLRISVIMGSNAPALQRVSGLAQDMPWPTEVAVDVPDMAARMVAADLAIGAAGATTWERCCLGLPSVIVKIADNQAGIAQAMAAEGAALDSGALQTPNFAQNLQASLAEAIEPERLAELSENAACICDGNGVGRVAIDLLGHLPKVNPEYQVRLACMQDAKTIWQWRNADSASRYYRSQSVTPLDAHIEWFREALGDPERILLIVERGSKQLGHVRFDRQKENRNCTEISIYVNPDYRGKGYGEYILKTSMAFVEKYGVSQFVAEVHINNTLSHGLFCKAGFNFVSRSGRFFRMVAEA